MDRSAESSERAMREARRYLARANEFERGGEIELADAAGAAAANRVARALRLAELADKQVVLKLVA